MITWINTADDIDWLRDVHIPNLPSNVKTALLFGNEDYPDKVSTFVEREPTIYSKATVYQPDEEGVYHIVPGESGDNPRRRTAKRGSKKNPVSMSQIMRDAMK